MLLQSICVNLTIGSGRCMRRNTHKLVTAGVTLAGFLCLLGGVALNALGDHPSPSVLLGGAGVLIMLAGMFVTAALNRRRADRRLMEE